MSTLNSSSMAESSNMDDNSTTKHHSSAAATADDEEDGAGSGDVDLWKAFNKNFLEVQSYLDQNRVLIQQVNENHQSKLPHNLTKNVALIRQINTNISTVASLYSNLSTTFVDVFHHNPHSRRASMKKRAYQSQEAA